jgi:hypothetical protein
LEGESFRDYLEKNRGVFEILVEAVFGGRSCKSTAYVPPCDLINNDKV